MPKRRKKPPLTDLAFERQAADLRLFIQSRVTPFKGDTAEKQRKRIKRSRHDRDYFVRTYFPHRVTEKSPAFHARIDEAAQHRRAAVQVFRGGAKTTRAFVVGATHDIIFGAEDYIQYYSTTDAIAESKLDQIRAELETNPRLHHDFGVLVGQAVWRDDRIVTANDVCIDAMGLKSAVRGLTDHKGRRPTKIIIDDPDEDEAVESDRQRAKLWAKITKAVIPSLDPRRGKLLVMGTAIHPECVIQTFMTDDRFKDFCRVDIPVEDPETGELAWPERFGRDVLDEILNLIGLAAYSSEYLNQPVDPTTQELTADEIRWFSDADLAEVEIIATVGALDPSLGKTQKSDYQAIIGCHVVRHNGVIEDWITHAELVRRSLPELIELVFNLHAVWSYTAFGIESVAFQQALKEWTDYQAGERGIWLNIEAIPNTGGEAGKLARIRGTLGFYKAGRVRVHESLKSSEFVRQLIQFPRGHDDGPDAAEMMIRLARKYGGGDVAGVAAAGRRSQVEQIVNRGYYDHSMEGYY